MNVRILAKFLLLNNVIYVGQRNMCDVSLLLAQCFSSKLCEALHHPIHYIAIYSNIDTTKTTSFLLLNCDTPTYSLQVIV